ncbi:MAG TPA: hypothetical protein VL691_16790 [Vicinamibacteria bacterium]|nr:hypothetical protein [Vicinamibacteria bacterium]
MISPGVIRVAIYSRKTVCTKGHRIEVSFEWDPQETTGGPKDYSEPCPVEGCDGQVAGKLPIGTVSTTLRLSGC